MEYGAIDLHLRYSQICIVDETGRAVRAQRIVTSRAGFEAVFAGRAAMRVVVESSTESEWVAQAVAAWGHEVIVVDPNYGLMYGHRSRGVKTDRRDAAALAEACRRGVYRPAHRVSATQRGGRRALRVREQLVRIRTQLINQVRAQLRQEGYRLPSGSAEHAVPRLTRLAIPAALREALAPVVAVLETVGQQVAACTAALARTAQGDPVVQRLMTAPGVGPITALTYRAVLDDVARFREAGAVSAYLGLVPREDSTGERQRRGAITKAGPSAVRVLLIQAGWVIWRGRGGSAALYGWVQRLAERRGRRIALVALARRLSRILYAMWRDETTYRVAPVTADS
jgi:transposase